MGVSSKGFQCVLQKGNETACLAQHLPKMESPFKWLVPFTCEKAGIVNILLGHFEQ